MPLSLSDFDYDLPPELIAQSPCQSAQPVRLMVVGGSHIEDRRFAELPRLLDAGDLLVFNDTRVLHARLHGVRDSGGRVEVLIRSGLSGGMRRWPRYAPAMRPSRAAGLF
ncbi:MAG: S-adenosylmethionine:tRNA ribosyltransferase-isomerase [Rhodocyclaceae bacterium]|nr:S-adenosylmethionine:tRNA ribosyltransferase-isomerase [Rhodocyclaceae bacterium]